MAIYQTLVYLLSFQRHGHSIAGYIAILSLAVLSSTVAAQDGQVTGPPPHPGIGLHDPRVLASPDEPPWRAVGKLQATAGGLRTSCTATLVGPTTVLTAAHCLFNHRTGQYFRPSSLHFLIGYDAGKYAGHASVLSFVTGSRYSATESGKTRGSDWALLTIDAPLGTPDRVLPIRASAPETGMIVMVGGYSQDRPLRIAIDRACHIVGHAVDGIGNLLLRHNCTATHGVSGAPILVRDGGGWSIGGVHVAAEKGVAVGVAAILDEARKRL